MLETLATIIITVIVIAIVIVVVSLSRNATQHARLLRHTIHFFNYLLPDFQGHEQLIEMENKSSFSHIRTYVRVLHRDDDYLDHAVMQVSLYTAPSPLSMQ